MKVIDKSILKIGDLVWFHNWGIGGFLFGVIVKCEEELFTHNTIHIWRPKSNFSLNDVDAIELIEKIDDVKEYALNDFYDFINDVEMNNITYNFYC